MMIYGSGLKISEVVNIQIVESLLDMFLKKTKKNRKGRSTIIIEKYGKNIKKRIIHHM